MEKKSLTESELYNLGASMCAGAEHCSAEVQVRLQKGTDDQKLVAKVIARLCADQFIDENRYVKAFIHDKLQFAKWGRMKIRQELWRKQIPEALYNSLLSEIDEKQYVQTLKELLKTKKKTVRGKDDYEVKMKLMRFGLSRGFEPRYIQEALHLEADVRDDFGMGTDDF